MTSVALDFSLSLTKRTRYIVDTRYSIQFIYKLSIPLTNIILSNRFLGREKLIHHYSVPGDVTQVTKQIFWFQLRIQNSYEIMSYLAYAVKCCSIDSIATPLSFLTLSVIAYNAKYKNEMK